MKQCISLPGVGCVRVCAGVCQHPRLHTLHTFCAHFFHGGAPPFCFHLHYDAASALCILCILFSQLRVENKINKKYIYIYKPTEKVRKVCKVCRWPCGRIRGLSDAAYFVLEVCTSQKSTHACRCCTCVCSNKELKYRI